MAEIRNTLFLPLGKKLTLTSDEFTTGHYFQQKPGAEPSSLTSITVSTAAVIESTDTTRCFVFVTNAPLTFLVESSIASDANGLDNIVEDTSPQLGGNLDINGFLVDGRVPSTDGAKLDLIEAKADVTDEGNVVPALDGASIPGATIATGDKVLLQDINDADSVKTATAQSIANLFVETHTASSSDTLTNKTFDANASGNSLSNVDVADLANGTDGELITWSATGVATTVAVGTSTHVLTSNGVGVAPTFQVAGGGGSAGWTLLSSVTASAASTIDFDNFLDSTYEAYVLIFSSLVFSVDSNALYLRLGTGAGPTYQSGASDYRWAHQAFANAATRNSDNPSDGEIVMSASGLGIGNAAGEEISGMMYIHSPDDTGSPTYMHGNYTFLEGAGAEIVVAHIGARMEQNTAATSVRLLPAAGNLTGEVKLYGIIKS